MNRSFRIHVALLAGALVATPFVGRAVDTPSPEQRRQAQTLATEALDCLRRGEDASAERTKLTAYRDGLTLAKKAVDLDDTNVDAQFALFATEGRVMLGEGAVPNPVTLYKVQSRLDHVLELDPDYSDALAAKGGLYRQLPWALGGSLEKAEDCLTRAIKLNPDAIGARIELAATYRDMGRRDEALPLLEEAADIARKQGRSERFREANKLLDEIGQAH